MAEATNKQLNTQDEEKFDFSTILDNQTYASPAGQKPLTIEDLQRTINDLKEKYGDSVERHYLPKSPEEYRRICCLPSRKHEEDIAANIVLDQSHWPHLNLHAVIIDDPCAVNEVRSDTEYNASFAWFKETFRDRLECSQNSTDIAVTSRIYEEGRDNQ